MGEEIFTRRLRRDAGAPRVERPNRMGAAEHGHAQGLTLDLPSICLDKSAALHGDKFTDPPALVVRRPRGAHSGLQCPALGGWQVWWGGDP